MPPPQFDAVVVGSGPNGLSAAIALANHGFRVVVLEEHETIGGGMRTLPLTRPGFCHDICSSIHPMALASPFWKTLPLAQHGLEWIQPPTPLAHPFDDGTAAVLERSLDATADSLGADGAAYRQLMGPLVPCAEFLFSDLLGPPRLPRHAICAARFGYNAIRSIQGLVDRWFTTERGRAFFAGLGGHSVLPMEKRPSAAIAMMLGLAGHVVGWPSPLRGAQAIADALAAHLRSLGGSIELGRRVTAASDLPPSRVVLLDLSPNHVVEIAGDRLTSRYRSKLLAYRYGPGVFKIDYALHEGIPWTAEACRRAGTVHIGGSYDEIAASERAAWNDEHASQPYLIVTQPGRFDATRAPAGRSTAWAYCHVPNGSTVDMSGAIEAQIERFAPNFRDCVLARSIHTTADMERYNPNYVGGDITGGAQSLWQTFARPVASLNPYATSDPDWFICSASTPPGGGVHGMCGFAAAQAACRRLRRLRGLRNKL